MPALGGRYTPLPYLSSPVSPFGFAQEKVFANIPLTRILQMSTRGGLQRGGLHVIGAQRLVRKFNTLSYLLQSAAMEGVEKGLKIFEKEAKDQLRTKLAFSAYSTGTLLKAIAHDMSVGKDVIEGKVFIGKLQYPRSVTHVPGWKPQPRDTQQVAEMYVRTGGERGTAQAKMMTEIFGKTVPIKLVNTSALWGSASSASRARSVGGVTVVPVHVKGSFHFKFRGFNFMQAAFKKRRKKVDNLIKRALSGRMSGSGIGQRGAGGVFPGGLSRFPAEFKAPPAALSGATYSGYGG